MLDYNIQKRRDLLIKADTAGAAEASIRRNANAINLELDSPIFRIFSYERFLELVQGRKNTLVRPTMWDDPFENILFNHEYRDAEGQPVDVSIVGNRWYGQCWTHNEQECDGLWRVYTNNRSYRGIRVKTTVRKIFEPLFNGSREFEWRCFIGRVKYDFQDTIEDVLLGMSQAWASDRTNVSQMQALLTKRKEFEYEHEVRILYFENDTHYTRPIFQYDIDPNSVFEEVLLDPWCPDELVETIKHDLNFNGLTCDVKKSQLYAPIRHITTVT